MHEDLYHDAHGRTVCRDSEEGDWTHPVTGESVILYRIIGSPRHREINERRWLSVRDFARCFLPGRAEAPQEPSG